jgi:hypothetical protein
VPVGYEPSGYNPSPQPSDVSAGEWPGRDQPVRFAATVANRGAASATAIGFIWRLNGEVVDSGSIERLDPGATTAVHYTWPWQDDAHAIAFELTSRCQKLDQRAGNDLRIQRSNALLLTAKVWDDYASYFETTYGAEHGSIEDWIQRHADRFNRILADATSDLAREGVLLEVAVHSVERVPTTTPDPGGTHVESCPTDLCWGWVSDTGGAYRASLDRLFAGQPEPGLDPELLRAWAYQLGLIDPSLFDVPMARSRIEDITVAAAYSSSSSNRRIEQLFDGDLETPLVTFSNPGWVWFMLHFPEPEIVSKMRLRVSDTTVCDWQVWSSDQAMGVTEGVAPALLQAEGHIPAELTDFAELSFAPTSARYWLIRVDRQDGDEVSHVIEWEVHGPNGKLSVLNRVAGSPAMPDLGGGFVHRASVDSDLMRSLDFELSPFHAWALNTTATVHGRPLPRRRGWYGDYLFNLPAKNVVVVTSGGVPLNGAAIDVYQLQDGVIEDVPKFSGSTNIDGHFELPEYITPDWATHFGMAYNVQTPFASRSSPYPAATGENGVLLLRISADRPPVYRFLDLPRFNLEYAQGNTQIAWYPIEIDAP